MSFSAAIINIDAATSRQRRPRKKITAQTLQQHQQDAHQAAPMVASNMAPFAATQAAPTDRDWLFADEVLALAAKPFLIAGLLVDGSFNLLISPRKVGKTLVTTDLACSVAAGFPQWAGHRIAKAAQGGLVIYVLGEGVGRFKYRLAAWAAHNNVPGPQLARSFVLYKKAVNLLDEATVTAFITEIVPAMCSHRGHKQPALVVFDTWSRCVKGAENDETFNTAVGNIDRIREETGATILALHHVPKAANRTTARGSGVLEGAIDTMFALDGDPLSPKFSLELEFARDLDAGDFTPKFFDRRTIQFDNHVDPETGEPETGCALQLLDSDHGRVQLAEDLANTIRRALASGPLSRSQLTQRIGRKKADVLAAVTQMLATGRLVERGAGRSAKVAMPGTPVMDDDVA